jgi:hypothetical protein
MLLMKSTFNEIIRYTFDKTIPGYAAAAYFGADNGFFFKDQDIVSMFRQNLGSGKPSRSCSDYYDRE